MGREAVVHAEVGSEAGEVRALLESTELILRGEIKRRFAREKMGPASTDGEMLRFHVAGEAVSLHLGAKVAESWAAALAAPPRSLRAKLGLEKSARAILLGVVEDEMLAAATSGALVEDGNAAQMIIAMIDSPADLAAALRMQSDFPALPLWTVYPKGRGTQFGDSDIRAALRASGLRDTKSCAVSEKLTATRYHR